MVGIVSGMSGREIEIHTSGYGDSLDNFHIRKSSSHPSRMADTLEVCITYPAYTDAENNGGGGGKQQIRYVEVTMESVRATDGFRTYYDFERDGFVIQQASKFSWSIDDPMRDPDWQEVAFIQSWARDSERD
jgi:hypothetical protein